MLPFRDFNPRSREGSDLTQTAAVHSSHDFNPRSREGSDFHRHPAGQRHKNFNPRSREGSDLQAHCPHHPQKISIHAPAKGATADMQAYVQKCRFQSTLPRRERRSTWFRGLKTGYFNPRSREGSDLDIKGLTIDFGISIHAPAKGATHFARNDDDFNADFNPRSREGSDMLSVIKTYVSLYFNPRSREGSDQTLKCNPFLLPISIHAPAKGATG